MGVRKWQFWLAFKGQLVWKGNCQAVNLPKNEWMNSFLLLWDVFSFLFWKKLKTPKRHFEIIWPLVLNAYVGGIGGGSKSLKMFLRNIWMVPKETIFLEVIHMVYCLLALLQPLAWKEPNGLKYFQNWNQHCVLCKFFIKFQVITKKQEISQKGNYFCWLFGKLNIPKKKDFLIFKIQLI